VISDQEGEGRSDQWLVIRKEKEEIVFRVGLQGRVIAAISLATDREPLPVAESQNKIVNCK